MLVGETVIAQSPMVELHLLDIPEQHDAEKGLAALAGYVRAQNLSYPGMTIADGNAEIELELNGLPDDVRALGDADAVQRWQAAGGELKVVSIKGNDTATTLSAQGALKLNGEGQVEGQISIDSTGVAERIAPMLDEPIRTLVLGNPKPDGSYANVLNFHNGGIFLRPDADRRDPPALLIRRRRRHHARAHKRALLASACASCGRPKSGAAVSWPALMIERRMARVRVNIASSAGPSPVRTARCSTDRSSEKTPQHFQHRVAIGQEHVAPHHRIGRGDAGEIAEARGRELDDLRLRRRFQIGDRADDVVGDQMRNMAGDRQHHVVMAGIHHLHLAAHAAPEGAELLHLRRRHFGAGRQHAPAADEQFGKPRRRPRMLGAGDRMAGNEMHALGHQRRQHLDHMALDRADIGEDRARLQRRRRSRPSPPHRRRPGVHRMTRSAPAHRFGRIERIDVAQPQLARLFQRIGLRVEMAMTLASPCRRAASAMDEPIRPMPISASFLKRALMEPEPKF